MGGGIIVCVVNLEWIGGVFLYEVMNIFWILGDPCESVPARVPVDVLLDTW